MTKGAVLLRKWRGDRTQLQAAEIIGLADHTRLSKFERGDRPGLDQAVLIERGTGGAVPVESWTEEAKQPKAG